MKINKEKVEERLAGVPESKRSHIYDASIVIEFLTATFMPTRFFLPDGFSPVPGTPLGEKSMRKVSEGKAMSMGDLYNLYQLYREDQDYTMKIESKYIFSIIIRNLRLYKNHWEFVVYRVGVAQIWHVGPVLLRADVPAETRAKYSIKAHDKTVEGTTVEADPVSEPEEESVPDDEVFNPYSDRSKPDEVLTKEDVEQGLLGKVEGGDLAQRPDVDRFTEATGSRFKENKYDPEAEAIAREEY